MFPSRFPFFSSFFSWTPDPCRRVVAMTISALRISLPLYFFDVQALGRHLLSFVCFFFSVEMRSAMCLTPFPPFFVFALPDDPHLRFPHFSLYLFSFFSGIMVRPDATRTLDAFFLLSSSLQRLRLPQEPILLFPPLRIGKKANLSVRKLCVFSLFLSVAGRVFAHLLFSCIFSRPQSVFCKGTSISRPHNADFFNWVLFHGIPGCELAVASYFPAPLFFSRETILPPGPLSELTAFFFFFFLWLAGHIGYPLYSSFPPPVGPPFLCIPLDGAVFFTICVPGSSSFLIHRPRISLGFSPFFKGSYPDNGFPLRRALSFFSPQYLFFPPPLSQPFLPERVMDDLLMYNHPFSRLVLPSPENGDFCRSGKIDFSTTWLCFAGGFSPPPVFCHPEYSSHILRAFVSLTRDPFSLFPPPSSSFFECCLAVV